MRGAGIGACAGSAAESAARSPSWNTARTAFTEQTPASSGTIAVDPMVAEMSAEDHIAQNERQAQPRRKVTRRFPRTLRTATTATRLFQKGIGWIQSHRTRRLLLV